MPAGRYDIPVPESTISPHSGTKNLATAFVCSLSIMLYSYPSDFFLFYSISCVIIVEIAADLVKQ
jgi:hypothetical protein